MTNKEIEQAEKELSEIEKIQVPIGGTPKVIKIPLTEFAEKYGIHKIYFYEANIIEWIRLMFDHCHTFLQTKMMLNACISARSSCKWAAMAATIAAISVIAGWYIYLFKMIILMFKGI